MRPTVVSALLVALAIANSCVVDSTAAQSDDKPDGRKSLGGSGEMIQPNLPVENRNLAGIKIHGSRYGTAEAPNERFLVYVLTKDLSEVIATEMAPYSLFERGEEKWVAIKFRKPIALPEGSWIAVDFRAGRTKGVYVSFDSSTDGTRSRVGLPGVEPKSPDFAGDWTIEPIVSQ